MCPPDEAFSTPLELDGLLRRLRELEIVRRIPDSAGSDGTTDRIWVKSKDARYASANGRVDILAKDDNQQVAGTLNGHLY